MSAWLGSINRDSRTKTESGSISHFDHFTIPFHPSKYNTTPRRLSIRRINSKMAYNGRRGPNVSQYIANLNAIPTAQELHNSAQDNFNIDDDLAMFTNTQFFDFDVGHEDLQGDGYEGLGGQSVADESLDLKAGLDFNTGMLDSLLLCF